MKNILKLSMLLLIVCSCASKKDIVYLQDIIVSDKNKTINVDYKMPVFKIDDRLIINISSTNAEAARPFNLFIIPQNSGGVSASGQVQQQSYLIDVNGEIDFPELGKISVLGKNRIELEDELEEYLKPFLPDVKANVRMVGFRVSVLGEVNRPGEFSFNRDKVSILQALGLAGDLTIYGTRHDIKLIRNEEHQIKYYNIDLTKSDFISSPQYFLQQNDVIYVAPNKARVNASVSSPTASYMISATGLLITIISILTR